MNDKIDFDYNKGYLELLSLGGLKPEPINTKLKVIIIGDYETIIYFIIMMRILKRYLS